MINQNLAEIAQQLYNYWFVQFDFPNDEGNPYRSGGGAMSYDSTYKNYIPTGWKIKKFEDICSIKRGASPRPIDEFMDPSHTGMPWLKISDATKDDSPYITTIKEHIIEKGISKSVRVTFDTFVVSNSATPGIPKFMQIEACVHDGWLVLDNYKEICRYYLYFVIKMVRNSLLNMASGSVFKNLNTDYLKQYLCVVPPTEIMQLFDNRVRPIMKQMLILQHQTDDLQRQRDELLPLLMNGQVSVTLLNSDLVSSLYYSEQNNLQNDEGNNNSECSHANAA